MKILVADDHRLFRAGLISMLKELNDVEIVAEANDGEEVLKLLISVRVDLVLLDINMPHKNGYEVLQEIKKRYPRIKVVMVSTYESDSHIMKAVENGACGYLPKNANPEEIAAAISCIEDTGFYFNDRVNKAMLSRVLKGKQLPPAILSNGHGLTDLEIEVLRMVCEGLTSAEIAPRLSRSARTIESMRNDLVKKTGVKNVAGLVVFAISNGYYEV